MGKEKVKEKPVENEIKEKANIEFSLQDANAVLAVFDLAIRAPNSNIDALSASKLALKDRFEKAFKG